MAIVSMGGLAEVPEEGTPPAPYIAYGLVETPDGSPAPQVAVACTVEGDVTPSTWTDESGAFFVDLSSAGGYTPTAGDAITLDFDGGTLGALTNQSSTVSGDQPQDLGTFTLEECGQGDDPPPQPPYLVYGSVKDSNGNTVGGASVTCTGQDNGSINATTSNDGNFLLDLTDVPGYAPTPGDVIQIDISSNGQGELHDQARTITGNSPQDLGTFTLEGCGPVHNLNQDTFYNTIQSAIENASANDTIAVSSGTYQEHLNIDKPLILKGEDRNTTVIDGQGVGDVVTVNANWVRIGGFSIMNSGDWGDVGCGLNLNASSNCIIEDNLIYNNCRGIYLLDSDENIIRDNHLSENYDGIHSSSSDLNLISNNTVVSNAFDGTYLASTYENTLIGNTIEDNGHNGITIYYSGSYNSISTNEISSNGNCGIYLYYAGQYNNISGNDITSNTHGIYLGPTNNNDIQGNNISLNDHGIFLDSSTENHIYHNNFLSNSVQVYKNPDQSYNGGNVWDDGYPSGGNHWSDWTAPDANGDGFVDEPYVINDTTGMQDNYPFTTMNGWINPPIQQGPVHNLNQDTYYGRIQWAVENASAGDTILVGNGTYLENVVIDRGLALIGECVEGVTVNGQGIGDAIMVTASNVEICQMTLTNDRHHPYASLHLREVINCTVSNVTMCNNYESEGEGNVMYSWYGLYLNGSDCNSIHDNVIQDTVYAIELHQSDSNVIVNNIIDENQYGIDLHFSMHTTIYNNTMIECGVLVHGSAISHWSTHTLASNTVNGGPLVYLVTESGLTVQTGSGQVILVDCEDITVEGQSLHMATEGIQVAYSSGIKLLGNTISGCSRGIRLYECQDVIVEGNAISDGFIGIEPWLCSESVFSNNTLWDNTYGIDLGYHCNDNIIIGNNATVGVYGILDAGFNSNNTHVGNVVEGMKYGIYISYLDGGLIVNNTFEDNDNGIWSRLSTGNLIYHNNLVNNTCQVYDSGNNSWDNGYPDGGNYWSDWTGPDADGDGFVDEPYVINETTGMQDSYPFVYPEGWVSYPPVADAGPDQTVYTVEPVCFDGSGSHDQGGVVVSYQWDFGDGTDAAGIVVSHSYLGEGTYTVTLTVTDDDNHTGTDDCTVAVLGHPPSVTITQPQDIYNEGVDDMTGENWEFYCGVPSSSCNWMEGYSNAHYSSPERAIRFLISGGITNGRDYQHLWAKRSYPYHEELSISVDYMLNQRSWTDSCGGCTGKMSVKVVPHDESGNQMGVFEYCLAASVRSGYDSDATMPQPGVVFIAQEDMTYVPGEDLTPTLGKWYTLERDVVEDWPELDWSAVSEFDVILYQSGGWMDEDVWESFFDDVLIGATSGINVYRGESITFDGYFDDPYLDDTHSAAWDFGDGTATTGAFDPASGSTHHEMEEVEHTYNGIGVYQATLSIADGTGDTSNASIIVNVINTPPTANASAAEQTWKLEPTSFDASNSTDPDGEVVTWHWDFGDGEYAEGELVNHTYQNVGSYNVTLVVQDNDGATSSDTRTITVLSPDPIANAGPDQTTYTLDTVTFDASNSSDPDGVVVSYHWDFGDGANASGPVVSHTYTDDGIYTVSLAVTDDDDATSVDTCTITVLNRPPTAVANATEQTQRLVLTTFDASGSTDQDGVIVTWHWDFGDGEYAEGELAEHRYKELGAYIITLTVTDDDGDTGTDTRQITVEPLVGDAFEEWQNSTSTQGDGSGGGIVFDVPEEGMGGGDGRSMDPASGDDHGAGASGGAIEALDKVARAASDPTSPIVVLPLAVLYIAIIIEAGRRRRPGK